MLESELRVLFERQADSEPQPSPISIAAAQQVGRTHLRRRRVSTYGSPVLAVGAVLAVVFMGALAPGPAGRPHPLAGSSTPTALPSSTYSPPRSAPPAFNPFVPFAAFGWLPFSTPVVIGGQGRAYTFLEGSPPTLANTLNWQANAAGACRLTGKNLVCADLADPYRLTGRAPDINGRVAYWGYVPLPPPGPVNQILAYQYARNGWATIEFVGNSWRSDVVKVAQNIRLGQQVRLRYAVQLTALAAQWHPFPESGFHVASGRPLADQISLTEQPRPTSTAVPPLQISTQLAGGDGVGLCKNTRWSVDTARGQITVGPGTRQVINGYHVYVNAKYQILCADDADGLSLSIQIQPANAAPGLNVVSIFARRLRLLGTDPAKWTTDPIAP
jgi:hypothetical protein